jgi:hypothetical protein
LAESDRVCEVIGYAKSVGYDLGQGTFGETLTILQEKHKNGIFQILLTCSELIFNVPAYIVWIDLSSHLWLKKLETRTSDTKTFMKRLQISLHLKSLTTTKYLTNNNSRVWITTGAEANVFTAVSRPAWGHASSHSTMSQKISTKKFE